LAIMEIKIATWNITGGRYLRPPNSAEYGEEDVNLLKLHLAKLNADVVCLQENHINPNRSIAQDLATDLEMHHVFQSSASLSYIDPRYGLGSAIISKFPLTCGKTYTLPYPEFTLRGTDGRKVKVNEKTLQVAEMMGVAIANVHLHPIDFWQRSYESGVGRQLARTTEGTLYNLESPFILCGDFHMNKPVEVFYDFCDAFGVKDALPDKPTHPNRQRTIQKPDHILYSQRVVPIDSGIIQTYTDHYLCWALLAI
jgi:endonuclease/exonuclease/phosphatase family metal-dependent hydrolase